MKSPLNKLDELKLFCFICIILISLSHSLNISNTESVYTFFIAYKLSITVLLTASEFNGKVDNRVIANTSKPR